MLKHYSITNESNLAGFLMVLGGIIILITILFEYRIGWIGVERPESAIPPFIFNAWSQLRLIWGWQVIGFFFIAVAYLLLLKSSVSVIKSLFWAVVLLCTISLIIAFGITLGSYYTALEVYDEQPIIFDALRGAVRSLYSIGLLSLILLIVVHLHETFGRNGTIHRKWGLAGFSIVVIGVVLSFVPGLPGQLIGAVIFFIPVFIGFGYWRNT